MDTSELTARREIREYVTDLANQTIEDTGVVSYPDLAAATRDHFKRDATFIRHMEALIYAMAYTALQRWGAERRGERADPDAAPVLPTSDGVVATAALDAERKSRWAQWVEHAGEKVISLKEMTRTDLIAAAEERETRASTEVERAQFLRRLASDLEGPQRVGDRFSDADIAAIWKGVPRGRREVKRKTGKKFRPLDGAA